MRIGREPPIWRVFQPRRHSSDFPPAGVGHSQKQHSMSPGGGRSCILAKANTAKRSNRAQGRWPTLQILHLDRQNCRQSPTVAVSRSEVPIGRPPLSKNLGVQSVGCCRFASPKFLNSRSSATSLKDAGAHSHPLLAGVSIVPALGQGADTQLVPCRFRARVVAGGIFLQQFGKTYRPTRIVTFLYQTILNRCSTPCFQV